MTKFCTVSLFFYILNQRKKVELISYVRRYGISSKIKLKLVLYVRGMVLVKNKKVELVTEKVLVLVQKIFA